MLDYSSLNNNYLIEDIIDIYLLKLESENLRKIIRIWIKLRKS